MEYNISLNSFEGPLDLLLHLIDKAKIDIYDIAINEITDQYLDYLREMEDFNLDVTSEFLVMASTLLQIKSKRLLPKKIKEDDEDDPEEELINRLIEYKKYKEAAEDLKKLSQSHQKRFYKKQEDMSHLLEEELLLEDISLDKLNEAFNKILKENKKYLSENKIDVKNIQKEEFPVESSMIKLREKIENVDSLYFEEIFDLESSRSQVISMFLALLELVKIKYLVILQENNYSRILIKKGEMTND